MALAAVNSTLSPAQGIGADLECFFHPECFLLDFMAIERVGKGLNGRAGLEDGQDLMKPAAKV